MHTAAQQQGGGHLLEWYYDLKFQEKHNTAKIEHVGKPQDNMKKMEFEITTISFISKT